MTTTRHCAYGDEAAEYWTCCGHPADGSSGTGCRHEDGEPVCETHWDLLEARGEVSSAS